MSLIGALLLFSTQAFGGKESVCFDSYSTYWPFEIVEDANKIISKHVEQKLKQVLQENGKPAPYVFADGVLFVTELIHGSSPSWIEPIIEDRRALITVDFDPKYGPMDYYSVEISIFSPELIFKSEQVEKSDAANEEKWVECSISLKGNIKVEVRDLATKEYVFEDEIVPVDLSKKDLVQYKK